PGGTIDTSRGSEKRTYVIPRTVAATLGKAETRGLVGAMGRKILKVLVFPLIDPILGKVGDYFVQRWERKSRTYRVRMLTPDNYRSSEAPSLEPSQWKRLAAGR